MQSVVYCPDYPEHTELNWDEEYLYNIYEVKIRNYTGQTGIQAFMERATREYLAEIAKNMALVPFHGAVDGMASNLEPIVQLFPNWNVKEADGMRCALL